MDVLTPPIEFTLDLGCLLLYLLIRCPQCQLILLQLSLLLVGVLPLLVKSETYGA